MEALVRSVGRTNGHRRGLARLLRRDPRPRDDFAFDFRDRGEDVWKAMRF